MRALRGIKKMGRVGCRVGGHGEGKWLGMHRLQDRRFEVRGGEMVGKKVVECEKDMVLADALSLRNGGLNSFNDEMQEKKEEEGESTQRRF